jgi:hypothetical protein
MNAKHTPGPWRTLSANDYTYENGKALKIVAVNPAHHSDYKFSTIVYGDMADGRCEADARLIASAPDLLAALEAARDYIAAASPQGYSAPCLWPIDAAIAKARG